ncbi:MAG: 16S rRNA (cytidine(1402)-2'-O)-methyltransferase [Sphingomonadales bacterium]|nr:16S rRNA (cytidine(1402)-2'-O)-methyltransferase [Sphingomonadales bacterium]
MDALLSAGLYIVATPIGNLGDMTPRGAEILRGVAAIACEDTRVTGKLLHHLGIKARMIRYDDHAGDNARDGLLALAAKQAVALVSDAGTPLISDPGYKLVREARARGIPVTSLPGASAAIVALTLSGLPCDRFLFAGFLPSKDKARRDALAALQAVPTTLIFYETSPRLTDALAAIGEVLPGREVAVARELTKTFEECRTGSPTDLIAHYTAHPPKGEIVLIVAPSTNETTGEVDADALLRAALATQKPSQAAAEVARVTGMDRKALYVRALELK